MIKHTTEVKCVKDRYTIPVTVEINSSQRSRDSTINVDDVHHKTFVATKMFDPSVKFITVAKLFELPFHVPTVV